MIARVAVGKTRIWGWAAVAVVLVGLYLVYWRLSWAIAANSDSAGAALQAHDMLHGNFLLRGWWLSDVSFYTTELPQYALLELVVGTGPGVVHVAAAMSYTLIVLLVALLAAGPRRDANGGERLTRALLAAIIVASPQASGALTMLLGPDHTGTVVPVLAIFLLIDRMPPRWWVPLVVWAALTGIMVADSVVLFTAIVPLIVTAVLRAARPGRWYELSLALAAGAAAACGLLITRVIARFGGYQLHAVRTDTMPLARLPHDAWNTVQSVLELFGANVVERNTVAETALNWLHLGGVLLAAGGFAITVARLFRSERIAQPALAVAIVVGLGAFLISGHSSNLLSTREIVAVMPFGAVLAGRTLGGPALRISAWLRRRPAAAVAGGMVATIVLAGYIGGMAYDATRAGIPSASQDLAGWLQQRQLTDGLAGYWQSNIVTLDSGGRVRISAVIVTDRGTVAPYYWEASRPDYDPARRIVNFVVSNGPASGLAAAAIRTFGEPSHVYRYHGYAILTWPGNLLRHLG